MCRFLRVQAGNAKRSESFQPTQIPKAVENSDFARNLRSEKTFLASANTSQTVFKTFRSRSHYAGGI